MLEKGHMKKLILLTTFVLISLAFAQTASRAFMTELIEYSGAERIECIPAYTNQVNLSRELISDAFCGWDEDGDFVSDVNAVMDKNWDIIDSTGFGPGPYAWEHYGGGPLHSTNTFYLNDSLSLTLITDGHNVLILRDKKRW